MKDQQVEMIQKSVIASSSEPNLKKLTIDARDECNNHDAGYMTSSNDSLNVETAITDEIVIEVEKWRLNIPPKLNKFSFESIIEMLRQSEGEMDNLPKKDHRDYLLKRISEYYCSVLPQSLIEIMVSHYFHGDSGISVDVKPDWLDRDKFLRGQKFAQDHLFGIFYANLLSLMTMFSFDDGRKPLILTDKSSTPYTAFKRYLSTGMRVKNWFYSDPWTPGTPAYDDVRTVRRLHAMVRKKITEMPVEEYNEKTSIKNAWCPALSTTRSDMQSACPAPKAGQCPYNMGPFPKSHRLSQGEMACTQFAFIGLTVLYANFFGIYGATDDDLEALCHVWRGLGYLLGIEDEHNFCRGTLEDVRTRSRDFLEYWVKPNFRQLTPEWEHMMRCVIEGLQYYFPGCSYEGCLLDLADIMNLHMPRTYQKLSYKTWIMRNIIKFYYNCVSRFAFVRALMNRRLNRAMEKALTFDEQKHQQLKARSSKILDAYFMQIKSNEITSEDIIAK